MGLGTSRAHVLGREQQSFAVIENTNAQFTEPKTVDSLGLRLLFTPNVPRKNYISAYMASRDTVERITQKSEHSWTAEGHYIPSGTKNVPPDCGDMIATAMGLETIGTNDVSYTCTSVQALDTMSLIGFGQDILMQAMAGCFIDEMTISCAGGDEPRIKFSGSGADYAATGYTTATGVNAIGATTLNVASNGGVNFHNPSSSTVFARSAIGVDVSASGAVTAVADAGGGDVTMTSAAHGLSVGDVITTTDFLAVGAYNLAAAAVTAVPSVNTFNVTVAHGGTDTGNFTTMETGAITAYADYGDSIHVTVTSNGHGLTNGQSVTITGTTNYNGTFNVEGSATNTFRIIDTWVADDGTGTWRANSYNVTARSSDALTIAPGLAKAYSASEDVVPVAPTYTVTGSPIAGITGNLSWSSVDFDVTTFEITLKNNHKATADHAFLPHMNDVIPGIREITGKFTARLRQDFIRLLLARQDYGATVLSVWMGGAAQSGTRLAITASYCELEYSPINMPEAEEAMVDFTFVCLGSSGNDALTVMHT
jgi:hypothetical protein